MVKLYLVSHPLIKDIKAQIIISPPPQRSNHNALESGWSITITRIVHVWSKCVLPKKLHSNRIMLYYFFAAPPVRAYLAWWLSQSKHSINICGINELVYIIGSTNIWLIPSCILMFKVVSSPYWIEKKSISLGCKKRQKIWNCWRKCNQFVRYDQLWLHFCFYLTSFL